jgi:23S rRNA (guanine745-N1)-methyltransferase
MDDPCVGFLACPVCHRPLTAGPAPPSGGFGPLRCAAGHAFDRAREGYVNLLPAGHGRSGIRGDSALMVRARRRFLERGHYQPLARTVTRLTRDHLSGAAPRSRPTGPHREPGRPASPGPLEPPGPGEWPAPTVILDVGCGDGYYLGEVAREVDGPANGDPSAPSGGTCLLGMDVSAAAARAAARRLPRAVFFINDVRHRITMADASVDVILDIFSPRNPAEFARVARPGALLLVVIPGREHLAELRDHVPLLDVEPGKRARTADSFRDAFRLEDEHEIRYAMDLEGSAAGDLVLMTPSAWHLDDSRLAAVRRLPGLAVTASFTVLTFRRPG